MTDLQNTPQDPIVLEKLTYLVSKAKQEGADEAEAMHIKSESLSLSWRANKMEGIEQSTSSDLGLRVLIGKKQAVLSSASQGLATKENMDSLVEKIISAAKNVPEDPFCGLGDATTTPKNIGVLELYDPTEITPEKLKDLARETFDAALAVQGVTQCESASTGQSKSLFSLVNSKGFQAQLPSSSFGIGVSAIAGKDTKMTHSGDSSSKVFYEDLKSPSAIGQCAGERAAKNQNARKMPTCKEPVVFDPRVGKSILSHLASALSGSNVARGTSLLQNDMGKLILPENITIVDDPFLKRGLRSRPFDAEGLVPEKRNIVDKGRLTSWILDLRAARQLNLQSTGHAVSSPGGIPSPAVSNFYMEAGKRSPEELMKDIKQGFYVTELMGNGLNAITGDYSLSARGFWIENGEITFPVHEMTIASNLKDMLLNLHAASDLKLDYGINVPTLRIENMTIAGS